MIAYPAGLEPDMWEPHPPKQTHRFALGRTAGTSVDAPPLITICMNPSYADHRQADKTVNRVVRASLDNGYPGWVVLNLYPERATTSSSLSAYDSGLSAANCWVIERVLTQFRTTEVLCAWGGLKHKTLRDAKSDVLDTLESLGTNLYTFDGLTTSGDPLHPTPRGKPLQMRGEKHYLSRRGNRLVARVPEQ